MARIEVYLLDPEMSALNQLAQQEYRPARAQAALIIRNELKRLGMVGDEGNPADLKPSQPAQSEA